MDQSARDQQPATHAAGERVDAFLRLALELEEGELLVDATAGTAEIPRIQGLPLFESDFNVKSSDSPAKYDTASLAGPK